jgi:hypothetical protein
MSSTDLDLSALRNLTEWNKFKVGLRTKCDRKCQPSDQQHSRNDY